MAAREAMPSGRIGLDLVGGLFLLMLLLAAGPTTAAPNLDNPHGDLSIPCSDCHSTEGWTPLLSPLLFEHSASGFALEAGHREVRCVSCHATLEFANVGSACADCHLDVHLGELGFSCESCHSPAGWDPRADLADLHDASLFPLTGAHRAVDCAACHTEDPPFEFQLTPLDCFACHVDDYQNADLDHVGLGFPVTCEDCHRPEAWQPADFGGGDFDHDIFFPLRGGHAALDCTDCHTDGDFGGTPSDCFACHQDDYNSTTNPNHAALGFPTSCENCHGTTTWEGATDVNHNQFFPLNGVHAVLDCQECHADGFEGTPTDCFSCHQADYNATQDPNHAASGFGTMCEDCHNQSSWEGAAVDHDAFFPLTGAHAPLDCEACHADGFEGTPTDCFSCHADEYNGTTDPNHLEAGFPTDCEVCHNTSNWNDADFDHGLWPLTGQHATLDCEACHAEGYEGTPTDCFACHEDDYNGTTDPNHIEAGFPTNCEVCHNTSNWDEADFDHGLWPLTGQHANLDCLECHEDGYEGTPTDCVACHLDDYDNTTDPDHEAAGFPTSCEDCHNTSNWDDADFDHDQMYFPIYSGEHAGEWSGCEDCHVVPNDFGVFECIFCHAHTQEDMDDEHDEVGGYVYESQACFNCHPNGEE